MALGADRGRVALEVIRRGLRLAMMGVGLGLLGAVLLQGFAEDLVYGGQPGDPLPLLGAGLVLLAVTLAASLVPARSATRVDPVEAIRTE